MELEKTKDCGGSYYALVQCAKAMMPAGTPEKTVRQATWLYVQYGCNTYTDGPGYPFRPEDVRDALRLSREEGMDLAAWLESLGILKLNPLGRYYFTSRWM